MQTCYGQLQPHLGSLIILTDLREAFQVLILIPSDCIGFHPLSSKSIHVLPLHHRPMVLSCGRGEPMVANTHSHRLVSQCRQNEVRHPINARCLLLQRQSIALWDSSGRHRIDNHNVHKGDATASRKCPFVSEIPLTWSVGMSSA